jgi:hypothetical protein
MAMIESSGFGEFDRLVGLVRRTRQLLDSVVERGELPAGGADFLAGEALDYLDHVQSGFQGWLRSEGVALVELRYLLRRVAEIRADPPATEAEHVAAQVEGELERRIGTRHGPVLRARPWDLVALAHARVVLAWLPRLPDAAVRYPGPRRSYLDIATPRGPVELADRLGEIERELWRTATGRHPAAASGAFRRTYGFFDAADQLGLRAFPGPS